MRSGGGYVDLGRVQPAGIVSCMASNEDGSGMMAAGAYSGDAAVMDERTGELLYVLQGQKGGITQVHLILLHPSTLPAPLFLLS